MNRTQPNPQLLWGKLLLKTLLTFDFPRKSVRGKCLGSLDSDFVAKPFQSLQRAAESSLAVALIVVVAAEVLVRCAVSDDAVGDDQNRVCNSNQRSFGSSPGG